MKETIKNLLLMQGYNVENIKTNHHIDFLARWTPLVCALLGTLGLFLRNPFYFICLGLLTTIGAVSQKSFYDYLYNYFFRFIFHTEKTPLHSKQRQFGCAIGAFLYIVGGIGFYYKITLLAYIPTVFMISLAYIAAITQWCFASALYNLIFKKHEKSCC